ncbi:glycosyltransferase family protein [Aliarcobacter cryaerophilus]|uniref:hypothetical protein n=1 Tax=Aliarcobacter cryaerophilus TaxID=28198 RepID=UPI0021B44008|nr:hypothetical protein [Aliarcobacter cryaerophilus]MCT7469058.1 hypothetical protein [Aliarcobacter cryaerophilus]
MKIALISDKLTHDSLKEESNVSIKNITPLNYKLVLRFWKPDILFVESAWQGYKERWKYKIASYPDYPKRNNKKLAKVVSYAKRLGIPTVFWNKEDGDILWTHVTSPFLNANVYDDIINKYEEIKIQGFDSLMTTNLIQGFLWNKEGPINYDRTKEKWPRTQTIEPLHEINSAVFLANAEIYRNLNDRIGNNPYLY